MKSTGSPRRFIYTRWAEGPLEGMEDLYNSMMDEKENMKAIFGISAFCVLAFLTILILTTTLDMWQFIQPMIYSTGTFPDHMAYEIADIILTSVFIALAFIALLLGGQVLSFLATALKRFENVNELFGVDPELAKSMEEIRTEPVMKGVNILGAQHAFTRGISSNMPQASRQMLIIRTIFFMIPFYFWARILLLPLLFDVDISLFSGVPESAYLVFVALLSTVSIIAGYMIVEADRFLQVIHARMSFLERIKSYPNAYPAEGRQALRLLGFLKESENCFGRAVPLKDEDEGLMIKHASDECVLTAIWTDSAPTLEFVRRFYDASRSFVEGLSYVPSKARFVIVFSPGGGDDMISDEVESFILGNTIELGPGPGGANSLTVLQIIVEEGGGYSLFPFVE